MTEETLRIEFEDLPPRPESVDDEQMKQLFGGGGFGRGVCIDAFGISHAPPCEDD